MLVVLEQLSMARSADSLSHMTTSVRSEMFSGERYIINFSISDAGEAANRLAHLFIQYPLEDLLTLSCSTE